VRWWQDRSLQAIARQSLGMMPYQACCTHSTLHPAMLLSVLPTSHPLHLCICACAFVCVHQACRRRGLCLVARCRPPGLTWARLMAPRPLVPPTWLPPCQGRCRHAR
jgi:hypothetical protein